MTLRSLAALLLLATGGCGYSWKPFDEDGDGYSAADGDCWDAPDGPQGSDVSGAEIHPGAAEIWYDGVDQDCAGDDDLDADGDGYAGAAAGGPDCDDSDPAVNPDAVEVCDGVDNDCDGLGDDDDDEVDTVQWYADADSDGYGDPASLVERCEPPDGAVQQGGDCNDASSAIHPGAEEKCDDVDQDCDGETHDADAVDADTWYADADGDGFGDDANATQRCDAPEGYIADAGDCDDSDADVNPLAEEVCNAIDDNCDGEINEGPPEETVIWYPDLDGDGYGETSAPLDACTPPAGYTDLPGDCNDSDTSVNPGELEDCATEFDDDCNLDANEVGALNCVDFYQDADGDDFGDPSTASCMCAATLDRPVTVASDCDDDRGDIYPGAPEVCGDGEVTDCDLSEADAAALCGWDAVTDLADSAAVLVGEKASDGAGSAMAAAGDLDGDGFDDLVVGAPYRDSGSSSDAGAAYVVTGPITGVVSLGAYPRLAGASASGQAGSAVAGGFDLDADGYGDVAVGAPAINTNDGAAYVVLGPIGSSLSLGSADAVLTGGADYYAGYTVHNPGDLSGDGQDDLLVSGAKGDEGRNDSGNIWILFGPVSSGDLSDSLDYDALAYGTKGNEGAGTATSSGDFNGDGQRDFWTASPKRDGGGGGKSRGTTFLVLGPALLGDELDLNSADLLLNGVTNDDHLGTSLFGGVDVDADGYDDLLVATPDADPNGSGSGQAWLVLGPLTGTSTVSSAAAATVEGGAAGDALGTWASVEADLTGAGVAGLLLGAPGNDDNGSEAGAAYAVEGLVTGTLDLATSSASFTLLGAAAGDSAGARVVAVGDTDGNGYADLLVGSPGYDDPAAADAGAAHLLLNGKY